MRLLTIPLALTLAVLTAAYPHQEFNNIQGQQQHPFTSVHHKPHADDGYARFDNEQVLRVEVSSMEQLKKLEATVEDLNVDLWSNLRIGTVDVRVPASKLNDFKASISSPSTVMIPNLQDLVPEQAPALDLMAAPRNWNFTDDSFWLKYHDFATLNEFTEAMVKQFPKLVSRTSLGYTHEGREVFGMTIHGYKDDGDDEDENEVGLMDELRSWWSWLSGSKDKHKHKHKHTKLKQKLKHKHNKQKHSKSKKNGKPKKLKKHPKAIVIHGGQHAREWIGPAVVSYIAKELILGYGKNKKITRLVDQFEFTIIPVLNADGYAYTWERNRMWRKNRQPTSLPFCPGIDPNRNWGYMWNSGGSSGNPCSEAYHGPSAFAAKEPKMVADYILKKDNVVAYIDFHAYSQLWMSPFGSDCSKAPKDNEDIIEAATVAAKALKDVHGKKFAVGSVCNIIYQASGGSLDWTYGVAGVKYSFAVELRDQGRHGFLLPEEEIIPSSEETFAGVLQLVNFIRKREKQWGYMV
ncbi:Carboxypeptidase A4 [Haplosporangium sp. Z 767]|nr:Carboxypeptidase A4 [Haplosporangium sp. Z 11]KAF9192234.1 Carboxypeptidase A4 [Haplosporangium sp. Z 767]